MIGWLKSSFLCSGINTALRPMLSELLALLPSILAAGPIKVNSASSAGPRILIAAGPLSRVGAYGAGFAFDVGWIGIVIVWPSHLSGILYQSSLVH